MAHARIEVTDTVGQRTVVMSKPEFTIGRRENNDLRLAGSEVSRDHAEIVHDGSNFLLRDRGSRYGSFVNGEQVTERTLVHGDRIRLGRGGGADLVFLVGDMDTAAEPATATAIGDLRHVAALLEGLRALGSGRVLDDVLALVLDSAIEVSGAERGFIMLKGEEPKLEFKLARARGRITLPGRGFETSRKIPEEVFDTGKPRIEADLLDGDLANAHMGTVALGIRNVLCVPLGIVRYLDKAEGPAHDEERIGVLYLDSRERGSLQGSATRSALETLATEAAIAIENARLYRETIEKAKLDQEIRIAAEIQLALMPRKTHARAHFEAAATTLPCRSIGGDFFDYADLSNGAFSFALGDVAGKGPPAALMSALVQGILAAQTASPTGPAATISRVNEALFRRAIENRFVTVAYGQLAQDGRLLYCNAGHNPPLLVTKTQVKRLEAGGPILGLFEGLPFAEETVRLDPGDWVIVFSDGVSEALSAAGEEYGEQRIIDVVEGHKDDKPEALLDALLENVRTFTHGAPQSDDVTALVIRYRG